MKLIFKNQIAALFVIWFLFLCTDYSFSADTVSAKYFPLVVGNSYTYLQTNMFFQQSRSKALITKDTLINGKKYFYCIGFPDFLPGWIRYDSARSNLLKYTAGSSCSNYNNESIVDSLAMSINNSINCSINSINLRRCTGIGNQVIFGETRSTKSFLHDGLIYSNITYSSGIGMTGYCSGEPPPCETYWTLQGCVLNGVVYGDTLLTSVQSINTIVPDKFYLAQNYPNPFNPETNISFSIPEKSFVILRVYDVMGKEIEELVNQNFSAGSYQLKWNAGNSPSGIYYYKITAGDFSATRKMILVK
ncbi:MAG: T9SS type A sorting domain-containing protein [Bacteroidetes bacterium]|nr:T9SS type A sorting domain-containing protein [Bacteroidota bacterium]